jgi:hypothetical protein
MNELFKNSHDALTFAFHFSSEQYAQTPMAKRLKSQGAIGSGKGLFGTDGAGQAGFILAQVEEVGRINPLHKACIVSRYSPKFKECPCCGGDKMLEEYDHALVVLDKWALSCLSGLSLRQMRRAILRAYFEGDKKLVNTVADRLNVPRRTAFDHNSKIRAQLKKLDTLALSQIDERLQPMLQVEA